MRRKLKKTGGEIMLNKVILMGRLTADIELKNTTSGVAVTTFSIAVERNYINKRTNSNNTNNERSENSPSVRLADFVNIVAWRQTAMFISKYFTKGQMIAVEGYIQTRKYEDKDGNKRTAFEVVAEHVYFADSKKTQSNEHTTSENDGETFDADNFEEIDTSDEDLPF